MATLQVIQQRQIIQTVNLFEVHEKVNSVNPHGLEVPAELDVPDNLYYVFQQALQAASFLYTIAYALVKVLESALARRYLRLDPSSEVKRVVEHFDMCRTFFNLFQQAVQICFISQLITIEPADFSNRMYLLCLLQEGISADTLDES